MASINLRAGILRSLEAAKKNGVLGKDAILRKTMLDECKGERLEEVLAAFSTAVLRLVVGEEVAASGEHVTPALRLALENKSYKDDRTELMVLGLVLRRDVQKVLRGRREAQRRYRDFEGLLGVKERGVRRRREAVKERGEAGKKVGLGAVKEMESVVRNNWVGGDKWMETLLYGDASVGSNGPFGMEFDRVWRRVEQERLSELEEGGTGLLETLERRVRAHDERLQRWESWRKSLGGSRGQHIEVKESQDEPSAAGKSSGTTFSFQQHLDLQVGNSITGGDDQSRRLGRPQESQETKTLLRNLERDLAEVSGSKDTGTLEFLFSRREGPNPHANLQLLAADHDPVSEISDLEDDSFEHHAAEEPIPRPVRLPETKRKLTMRPKLQRPVSSYETDPDLDVRKPAESVQPPVSDTQHRVKSQAHSRSPEKRSRPQPPTPTELPAQFDEPSPPPLEPPVSPTREMAEEILESMKNASPSPAKPSRPRHKLSLAERTRLSMARGSNFFTDEDESDLTEPTPPPSSTTTAIPLNDDVADEDEPPPVEDLVSRTRRSMAGFEKAQQKAQMERRRSLRRSKVPPRREGSYFPKVEEEGDGGGVLTEELMAEEDMEAVFKSRPKIAASPLPSPTREMWGDEG